MFDSNAAHIPLGKKFFAEVRSTGEQLKGMGLVVGDLVLCSHISNHEGRPRFNHKTHVWASQDAEPFTYTFTYEDNDFSWLVYSGMPNGNGFIDDNYRDKAKEFLGGKWDNKTL